MKSRRTMWFCTASAAKLRNRFTVSLTFLFLLFAPYQSRSQNSSGATPLAQQSFALADTAALSVAGGKVESVEYLGRKAVRLTTQANSDIFAYVNGSSIQDGIIDVDIAVKITTPPGL